MSNQLQTPRIHNVIASPVGRLFHSRLFERFKIASVDREFTVLRARAAADVAGTDVEQFLQELDAPDTVDEDLLESIEHALTSHQQARNRFERLSDEWNQLFWKGQKSTIEERNELETKRRDAGGDWVSPQKPFKFLSKTKWVDIVDFAIPDPSSTVEEWSELSPETVYGPPESSPDIQVSETMQGPGTREYLLRFPSPSNFIDDEAYARVYEPWDAPGDEPLPTIIFGTGLAMACDVMEYWTEEEYVGRQLAPQGYRVILPIPPWHGRREQTGFYTGEPYLARMPVSAVELYEAQTKEIALLTRWARDHNASRVGVGGISMGGIVAMFVAGHADTWPELMQPDFALPVAASADVSELLFESSLTEILGVTDALLRAGWDRGKMANLDNVLTAPSTSGIASDEIYPVGGLIDDMTKYETLRETLDKWNVPQENRLEWDCGHFGVTLRAMRTAEFQDFVRLALDGQ
ncbi:alpha/beta hydrolase [Haloarcula rubripromontorii]|nr:alpha/beta hydrolase [Haloarcula rubripromontorii]NLV08078.1 alpha/beta hydrolase [Haloarcula rubripromontorii]